MYEWDYNKSPDKWDLGGSPGPKINFFKKFDKKRNFGYN